MFTSLFPLIRETGIKKRNTRKLLPCTFLAGNNYLAKTSLPFLSRFSLPSLFLLLANVIMLSSLYMLTFEDLLPRALNQPVRTPHSGGTYLGQQQCIHLVSCAGGKGPSSCCPLICPLVLCLLLCP